MIIKSHLKLLIRIHKIEPFTGSALCLGRQGIMPHEEHPRAVFADEGLAHHRLNSLAALEIDEKHPSQDGFITDRRSYAALGIAD